MHTDDLMQPVIDKPGKTFFLTVQTNEFLIYLYQHNLYINPSSFPLLSTTTISVIQSNSISILTCHKNRPANQAAPQKSHHKIGQSRLRCHPVRQIQQIYLYKTVN